MNFITSLISSPNNKFLEILPKIEDNILMEISKKRYSPLKMPFSFFGTNLIRFALYDVGFPSAKRNKKTRDEISILHKTQG